MSTPQPTSCPSCGASIGLGADRCPLCGTAVDSSPGLAAPQRDMLAPSAGGPTTTLECPTCGHSNPPSSRFCNACGAALKGDAGLSSAESRNSDSEEGREQASAAPRPSSAPGRQALLITGIGIAAVVALYLASTFSSRSPAPPPIEPGSAQPTSAVSPAPPLPDSLRVLVASYEGEGTAEGYFEAGRLYLTAAFESPEGGAGWAREALMTFERSLALEENPDVRVALAEAARLGGDPAQPMRAVEELQRVLADHPDHVGGNFVMADLRATIGRLDGAEELFEKVIRLTPPSDPVHLRAQQNLAAVREARQAQGAGAPSATTPAMPPR